MTSILSETAGADAEICAEMQVSSTA